jgi:hypothetical protein
MKNYFSFYCIALILIMHSIEDVMAREDTSLQISPAKVFQTTLAQVKSETQIPILLPSEFPAPIIENNIHFAVGNGTLNKYEITLFYEEGAGYAAFVGYFAGEPVGKFQAKGKKVNLVDGVTGYFNGKSCRGSCSPSQIRWQQDNVLYTLQIKLVVKTEAEEEQALTAAANSAILGGAR